MMLSMIANFHESGLPRAVLDDGLGAENKVHFNCASSSCFFVGFLRFIEVLRKSTPANRSNRWKPLVKRWLREVT